MMLDDPGDFLASLLLDLQSTECLFRKFGRNRRVMVEANTLFQRKCLSLTHIMKKRCDADIHGILLSERSKTLHRVLPHVAFMMIISRLRNTLARMELRQHIGEDPEFPEVFKRAVGMWPQENLLNFFKLSRAREPFQKPCKLLERSIGFRVVLTRELGSKAHHAHQPQCVVLNTNGGVPDEADQAFFQIRLSIKRIVQFAGNGMPVQRV